MVFMAAILLGVSASISAQPASQPAPKPAAQAPTPAPPPAPRLEIGPIVRLDTVSFENGATGAIPVAGVNATLHLSGAHSVEADVTQAAGQIERRYDPGIGWSAAFTARCGIGPRMAIGGRAGVAARQYKELSLVRDAPDTSSRRVRGGLLLGLDSVLELSKHMSVASEVRWVGGGLAGSGTEYREYGLGIRTAFRF